MGVGNIREFGNQFPEFARSALPVLRRSLEGMKTNAQTRPEYESNSLPLIIYGNVRPHFQAAFKDFETVPKSLLATLPK